jgi:hypothetical protein
MKNYQAHNRLYKGNPTTFVLGIAPLVRPLMVLRGYVQMEF